MKVFLFALSCFVIFNQSTLQASEFNEEATKKLFKAIFNGNLERSKTAIEEGADYLSAGNCSSRGFFHFKLSPIHLAAATGDVDIVEFLASKVGLS